MKKFKVCFYYQHTGFTVVKAKTEEEAKEQVNTQFEKEGLNNDFDCVDREYEVTYIDEVENVEDNTAVASKPVVKKAIEYTYCVMCCGDYPHITNTDDEYVCEECDNPASSGILERDEEIIDLAYENKRMSEKLLELGYSQEQISSICTDTLVNEPELKTPYIKELEEKGQVSFLSNNILTHIFESELNNGYDVSTFELKDIHAEGIDLSEGGLCTGSATNAIHFLS